MYVQLYLYIVFFFVVYLSVIERNFLDRFYTIPLFTRDYMN